MHLVSKKKGRVTKINHVQEIEEMNSVRLLEVEAKVGDQVVETVNIRTDSGYVLLENVDSEALQEDYNRILVLQETMFEVEIEGEGEGEGEERGDRGITSEVQQEAAPAVPVSKSRRRRRAHVARQDIAPGGLPEQRESFGEQSDQQGNAVQSFEVESLQQQQQQFKVTNSLGTSLLAQLKQKLFKIAIRASAILAGYCIAFYTAALVLPFIC